MSNNTKNSGLLVHSSNFLDKCIFVGLVLLLLHEFRRLRFSQTTGRAQPSSESFYELLRRMVVTRMNCIQLLLILGVLTLSGSQICAQNLTGEIDGPVRDSTNAVIPDTVVTVKNSTQNIVARTLKTNRRGSLWPHNLRQEPTWLDGESAQVVRTRYYTSFVETRC